MSKVFIPEFEAWRRARRDKIPGAYGSQIHAIAPFLIGAGLEGLGILGGGLANAFGGNKTVDQKPMLTEYQAGAQQALLPFGRTGVTPWGYDFTQGYGGPLGNYSMTPLESQGQGILSSTLSGGLPGIFQSGTGMLSNFLSTNAYDPNNDGGVYKGLSAGIDFNRDRAISTTKQGAAYQGNLYSTNAVRNIGDVSVQAENAKSGILANLYQNYTNQKLNAAGQAVSAGATQNNMNLQDVGAAMQYGQLARTLQDTQAKDAYSAWLTQRSSELQPLSALTGLSGANANYGFTSVPVQSPWNQLLNTMTSTGGRIMGNAAGPGGPGMNPWYPQNNPYQQPIGPQPNWGYYPGNE